jgi:hypothetical protein
VRDWVEHGVRQLANGRWAFRVDPALLDSLRRELAQPNGDEFLVAQLRKIRSPVLVVRGAESTFTTEAATRTASAIPGGGSWRYRRAGMSCIWPIRQHFSP